ncbi:hypothetical protein V8B97DRAFT_2106049 [Scleroderma yunnanense]
MHWQDHSTAVAIDEQTIYHNRPPAIIPVTLLHTVSGQFLDDCNTHEITADDNSPFYLDERIRTQAICDEFSKSNLHFVVGHVMEGHISVNRYRCVIALFNIEVDTTGADPYNQAISHYLESTRHYAATLWGPSLPCMIVLFLGTMNNPYFQSRPYIAFVGATWNSRPVVQTLSVALPMHYHSTDTDMQIKVARHLSAFKKAVRTLENPNCTYFRSLENNIVQHFEYISQPFPDKLIFFATLSDQQPVCIKFARQYSKDAHEACAALERAPALLGFEKIPGCWFMIVMDTLVDEYVMVFNSTPTPSLIDDIRNVLRCMSYGRSDVRETDIIVSRSNKTKLRIIDFDWGGKFGDQTVQSIQAEHVIDMLDNIKTRAVHTYDGT